MSRAVVMVVDDEPDIRRLVQEILEDENYQVLTAENAASARRTFSEHRPDLILLDIWMPDIDGISLLKEWSADNAFDIPVVIMSGHGNVETAVEATRLGAYDFIEKPVSMGKLLVTVERALASDRNKDEPLTLPGHAEPISALTGKSQLMQQLRDDLERIAATDAWVLISGEQGCGKAVAARYLHAQSARHHGPFVELSLAATSAENLLAQLLGSEHDGLLIPGAFDQARGGTLLLNEVGETGEEAQARLVHVLEDKRFTRIGGIDTVDLDVRIISTTTHDLAQLVTDGHFREDLYYRLNVVPVNLPALREHREDVPDLISFYVNWLTEHDHLPYRKFTIGALNLLRNYGWPGNIRELKNLVQRLLILNPDVEVEVAEAEQNLGHCQPLSAPHGGVSLEVLFNIPLRLARDQFEKSYLEYHLKHTAGNVSKLAEIVGMERTHLYRKLKQLGINPKDAKTEETARHKK